MNEIKGKVKTVRFWKIDNKRICLLCFIHAAGLIADTDDDLQWLHGFFQYGNELRQSVYKWGFKNKIVKQLS